MRFVASSVNFSVSPVWSHTREGWNESTRSVTVTESSLRVVSRKMVSPCSMCHARQCETLLWTIDRAFCTALFRVSREHTLVNYSWQTHNSHTLAIVLLVRSFFRVLSLYYKFSTTVCFLWNSFYAHLLQFYTAIFRIVSIRYYLTWLNFYNFRPRKVK